MEIRLHGWWDPAEEGKFTRQIHLSTHNRHLLKYNLEKFKNPHCLDSFGRSPLVIACLVNTSVKEIKILLEGGANVNCLWENHNPNCKISPLGIAIHLKNYNTARYLLQSGADPNLKLYNGNTALHIAIMCSDVTAVEMLIASKADVSCRNDFGSTSLQLAAASTTEVLKKVIRSTTAKLSVCDDGNETPLHIAAYVNNLLNFRILLERFPNVKLSQCDPVTIFHSAPVNSEVRQCLQELDPSCRLLNLSTKRRNWVPFSNYFPTPVVDLLRKLKPIMLRELLADDGMVKQLTKTKQPKVKQRGSTEADTHPSWYWLPTTTNIPHPLIQQITNDFTLYWLATDTRSSSFGRVVTHIVSGNAIEENDRFSCFMHIIASWGSFTCSYEALALGGLFLKLLLNVGVDINGTDEKGYTPLFALIEDGYENLAVYLLNNGADPNLKVNGITPLMMASVRGLKEVVSALIENGADIEAVDANGSKAIHMAAYYSLYTPPEVISLLLEKGADVNAKCAFDVTPLHLSAVSMSADRCATLLNGGAYIDAKAFGLVPLHLAFICMNVAAASILSLSEHMFESVINLDVKQLRKHLNRGAVVNCQAIDRGTPLMSFAKPLFTLHTILLLKYNPNYQIRDGFGRTCIHHAVKNKNYCTLVMYLKKWGIQMLVDKNNDHHIDRLIEIAESSDEPDWVMPGETVYVLRSWKAVYEDHGPDRLSQLINKHFHDYVGFSTLMLKYGWKDALKYFDGQVCPGKVDADMLTVVNNKCAT